MWLSYLQHKNEQMKQTVIKMKKISHSHSIVNNFQKSFIKVDMVKRKGMVLYIICVFLRGNTIIVALGGSCGSA